MILYRKTFCPWCEQMTVWGLVSLIDGFAWQCSCGASGPHEESSDLAWQRVKNNSDFIRISNLTERLRQEIERRAEIHHEAATGRGNCWG